eukprot:800597_1
MDNRDLNWFKREKREMRAKNKPKKKAKKAAKPTVDVYRKHEVKDTRWMIVMKRNLEDQIWKRVATSVTLRHVQAAILTPFWRDRKFDLILRAAKLKREDAIKDLRKRVADVVEKPVDKDPSPKRGRYTRDEPITSDELTTYLALDMKSVCSRDDHNEFCDNPMKFWVRQKGRFPALFKVARWVFITPSSSSPSECEFSDASLTATKPRNRLGGDKIDWCTFLGSWLRFKDGQ